MELEERIQALQHALRQNEAAVLTEYSHRVFLLKFPSSAGVIFLTRKNRYFLVDFRYIEMAGRIQNGFQVILQQNLKEQLQDLLAANQIQKVSTDTRSLTLSAWETLENLFPTGVLTEDDSLSQVIEELEQNPTLQELECRAKAQQLGQDIASRFAFFVRPGASIEGLKRKLTQLRGESGDESRTFASRFALDNNSAVPLSAHDVIPPEACTLEVSFSVTIGLTSQPVHFSFPIKKLSPVPVQQRHKYLKELISQPNTAVLLSGNPNIRYYLGVAPSQGDWLLVTEQQTFLIGMKDLGVLGIGFLPKTSWKPEMERILQQLHVETIFTERDVSLQTLARWNKLCFPIIPSVELEERIYRRRSVKSSEELERLRRAQQITDRVFEESLNYIHAGMTDIEIQRMVGMLFFDLGSEMESFNHVSGCGIDTSLPHVRPTGRIAKPGDFVMLDIGAQVEGYGSDMTRMVGIGELDEEKQQIYRIVLEAQNTAISSIRPGVACKEVDAAARQVIEQKGFGQYFLHGLGHPVGCGGHEGPRFNQTDNTPLHAGVVMTVEPGIYLPGKFGVRIEDMIYVGESGIENLTHSSKELICV